MKLGVVGSGYVGTTIAGCFAELGHDVLNVDIDQEIVDQLNAGQSPIHEPGLQEYVEEHAGDRLRGSTDYSDLADRDVTFLALPTPSNLDGSIDTSYVEAAAESVGEVLAEIDDPHLVVVKSTVVPGTTESEVKPALERQSGRTVGEDLYLAMNPEFLREGSAVADFLEPDKIVLGGETERAIDRLREVYDPLIERSNPAIVRTGLGEAEMIKYANNAFLATKVSLINELGNICKIYDVDAYEVAEAIGLDHRIDSDFLRSGLGWGGSCFPKDVAAIIAAARDRGYEPDLLEAAVQVNDRQPERFLELLEKHLEVSGKRIAVLGLSFKPGTDDIRESRAIPVIEGLQDREADIVAYDPVAMDVMGERFPTIEYAESAERALRGAHAALLVTGWDEFATLENEFESMATQIVIDGRHVLDPPESVTYEGLTW